MDKSINPILLVVEDCEENIEAAKKYFDTLDINVVYARDAREAEAIIEEGEISGALIDLFFPDQTGTGDKKRGRAIVEEMCRWTEHDRPDRFQWRPSCSYEEYFRPLREKVSSDDEAEQPMGVVIAEKLSWNWLAFMFVTSEYHHGLAVNTICHYQRGNYWPEMIDEVDKSKPETWEKAYKKLAEESIFKGWVEPIKK